MSEFSPEDRKTLQLYERLTFDKLFRISEPKRVYRSFTVKGPPLEIDSYQDVVYYIFNFKANPSTTGLRHRGYVKFFKPVNKSPKNVPLQHLECLVDCTCVAGSTKVLMSDGVYKQIKDIRPGDLVYTHTGRVKPVTGNVSRALKPGEKVYSVKVSGFPEPILATENHPFYTLRGNTVCRCGCGKPLPCTKHRRPLHVTDRRFIKNHEPSPNQIAADISATICDEYRAGGVSHAKLAEKHALNRKTIAAIVNGTRKSTEILSDMPDFCRVEVKDFRKNEWFLMPWLVEGSPQAVDSDLARFLGYYAAEGCFSENRVNFTLHLEEEHTLGADIKGIVERLYAKGIGFRYPDRGAKTPDELTSVCKHDGKNRSRPQQCFTLTCFVTPAFKAFIQHEIGEGSFNKRISSSFIKMNDEAAKQFLTGLFLGDGHVRKNGYFRYTSVSSALVYTASTLLNRLKIRHCITDIANEDDTGLAIDIAVGRSASMVAEWLQPYVRSHVLQRLQDSCKSDSRPDYYREEGSLRSLGSRTEVKDYDGLVWDLCVEDDHTFIAHGISIFNCPDYRYRWAWSNKQRQSSVVGPQSLNQAWNKAPRKTNPSGAPGLCVAKDELVTAQAGYIPIQDIKPGDLVWTLMGWNTVLASACTGHKPVLEVHLESGRKLRLTSNHPVYTVGAAGFAWVDAGNLTAGCFLCHVDPKHPAVLYDKVSAITAGGTTDVYDLTVENAEHFVASGLIVHNCKHILATRRFIYGLLSSFAGDQKDTAEKLDHLTKYATKRWTDFEGQMQLAKAKEAEFRRRRDARNRGQSPDAPPPAPPAAGAPVRPPRPPRAPAPAAAVNVDDPNAEAEFKTVKPEPLPPTEPGVAEPPGNRIQKGKSEDKPITKPKRVIGNRKVNPPKPGDKGWIKPEESYLCQPIRNLILDSVVNANGDTNMNPINEALKLVEEMEADEMQHLDSDPGADGLSLGGADGAAPGELPDPSEPPVSDSAIGADTEGDSALGLLRSMKTSLEQIAAAVAPVEELPPGGPAGAIGGPGDAGGGELPPGGEGGEDMPDEPPVDGDELGDVDDAGAEPFSKGGGKGGSKGAEGSRKREGSKGAEGSRDREEAE